MKIAFVTGFVSPHIIPLCDALSEMYGDQFSVFETQKITAEREAMGYGIYSRRNYVIPYHGNSSKAKFNDDAINLDLLIFSLGSADYAWVDERIRSDRPTVLLSERLFKRGALKLLDVKLWRQVVRNLTCRSKRNVYLFTLGAYSASDFSMTGFPLKNIRRFGYFPRIDALNLDQLLRLKSLNSSVRMIWIGRLIDWKRPVDVVKLVLALKNECAEQAWSLDIIGDGPFYSKLEHLIAKHGLTETVKLRGNLPELEIEKELRTCDIFISTSSKREGWGAVINESMSRACAVIATEDGGGAMELISHKKNGFLFKVGDMDALASFAKDLLVNDRKRIKLGSEAYKTISSTWNATEAATRIRAGISNEFRADYSDGPFS